MKKFNIKNIHNKNQLYLTVQRLHVPTGATDPLKLHGSRPKRAPLKFQRSIRALRINCAAFTEIRQTPILRLLASPTGREVGKNAKNHLGREEVDELPCEQDEGIQPVWQCHFSSVLSLFVTFEGINQ